MVILSTGIGHELNILLGICGVILMVGLLLKQVNQPYIIAYIITGVVLGPHGLKLVEEYDVAESLGELGLVILMFFIGMEISFRDFLDKWKVALLGTGMQVLFSVLLVVILGFAVGWPVTRMILLGFIISISSSAVVIKLIEDNGVAKTRIGENVISILLTQDIIIVPMIILMSFMGGERVEVSQIVLQVVGGGLVVALLVFLIRKETIRFPFEKKLKGDHELQVFASLIACFGLALVTSLFHLSAGLGAFVAGLFMHASPATKWLHESLHSFRVVLISVFFLSVGMLIDIDFLFKNWVIISVLVLGVYVSNHGINTVSLKLLGSSWKESIFGGSLLAQIGEFSFVLSSVGYHSKIITPFAYQLTIIVISITIFISPIWVLITRKVLKFNP